MIRTRKYQVWINDSELAGHIIVPTTDTEKQVIEQAREYAKETWDTNTPNSDVSVCEIPDSYYQDIARSSAKDSIELGM